MREDHAVIDIVSGAAVSAQHVAQPERSTQTAKKSGAPVGLGPLSIDQLKEFNSKAAEEDWVVESLIQPKSVNLAAGDSGLGKSPLLYQLGLCVAAGIPFLGLKTSPGRVLYLDLENGDRQKERMAERISCHLGLPAVPKNFHFWSVGLSGGLDLLKEVRRLRPALVIIDPLRCFDSSAPETNKAGADALVELREIATTVNTAFLVLHHVKKASGDQPHPPLEDTHVLEWMNIVSGGKALVNHSDTRIGLSLPSRRNSPAAMVLKAFTRVDGEFGPFFIGRVFDEEGEPRAHTQLCGADLLGTDDRAAYDLLPSEFKFKDARIILKKSSDQTVDNLLKRLQHIGLVEKLPGKSGYKRRAA